MIAWRHRRTATLHVRPECRAVERGSLALEQIEWNGEPARYCGWCFSMSRSERQRIETEVERELVQQFDAKRVA